ncbi:hypothetical protein CDL12_17465 [Handroanthus impetiginosus]|uniref:Putative plant transposon protein domain-containing protein n=1 Tax=Handroanthus impetiginosus TaxID=429701 RepID=A0A2G9GY62_9LAMI|nr:hypothetical protein CDL12_17465 [Handroanthus impetiginosus]
MQIDIASTNQGFDQRRFISQEAEDNYNERLLDRAVIRERDIQGIDEIAERRHWEAFINDPELQEFLEDHFPLDTICKLICWDDPQWTLSHLNEPIHFSHTKLTIAADNWLRFISARLLPITHTFEVTRERAVMIFAILTDVPFDISCFLHRSIWKSAMGRLTVDLYHASLITALCAQAGLERQPRDELLQPDSMLHGLIGNRSTPNTTSMNIPISSHPHYPPDEPAKPPPADMGND